MLVAGTILPHGPRTVAAALRAAGLGAAPGFCGLFAELLRVFVPSGPPFVVGLDETLEHRWGCRIAARGIYRDPVRSSRGHFVKAGGLRRFSLMLLAPVPWAGRVWALPVLTALTPSERDARERGVRHKELTDWARQALLQLANWLPGRRIVAVADRSYVALELLHAVRWVLVRDPAGAFDPQALLCTDLGAEPVEILGWSVRRWSVEVTFAEARRHLGMAAQRQWSDAAVAGTTPALLGLFSLVAPRAFDLHARGALPHRRMAWYPKEEPTFGDALAAVRRSLWAEAARFPASPRAADREEGPRSVLDRLTDMACLAA